MDGLVLMVGASDCSAWSGMELDLQTATALGVQVATAVTALTAQDDAVRYERLPIPAAFVARQIEVVLTARRCHAVKTGLLGSAEVIDAVVRSLERWGRGVPLVVEPVLAGRGGHSALDPAGLTALQLRLLPRAALVVSTVARVAALTGAAMDSVCSTDRAIDALLAIGVGAVVVWDVPDADGRSFDLLRTADGTEIRMKREALPPSGSVDQAGMLAAATAAAVAAGLRLEDAVRSARDHERTLLGVPSASPG